MEIVGRFIFMPLFGGEARGWGGSHENYINRSYTEVLVLVRSYSINRDATFPALEKIGFPIF